MTDFVSHGAGTYDLAVVKAALQQAAAVDAPYPADRFSGRGIVICAGGARMFTCAWITIALLRRHHGCTLPIEVWHLGPEEMGPPMRGMLAELGVEVVDAFAVAQRYPVNKLGGWELKPYALMHSRFSEVLLLDADNLPVRDPAFLFDLPDYRDTGALFWPDIVRIAADNRIWEVSGLAYRDTASFESGQMVVDKARCWRALSLTQWMNQRSDVFYSLLHGDKDTFLVAWEMLGQAYHLIRHRPKLLEGTMCQRDPDGAVLFQHRNGAKWVLDGLNPTIGGFRLETECRALLAQLASDWDGRVFNPPPRSDAARRCEAELTGRREIVLHRVSSDERRATLLPDHRLRSTVRFDGYWHVADGPEGLELCVERDGIQLFALRPSDDGVWRGRLLIPPGMPVELSLIAAPAENAGDAAATEVTRVLARILALSATLPADGEVARDLAGTLRMLVALDPAVRPRLAAAIADAPPSALLRAIAANLDEIAANGAVTPGSNWLNRYFLAGYEKL